MVHRLIHLFCKIVFWVEHARRFGTYKFSSTVLKSSKIQGHPYIHIEENVYVHSFSWLGAYKFGDHVPVLKIGSGTCLGNFNHISSISNVTIGKKVLTADHVYISDNNHQYIDPTLPIIDQSVVLAGEVVIGDGAWIGQNVSIIGASVGKNSVIGANSVVTRSIPDYCIAVGSPARVIKQYNFESKRWEKK